MSLTCNFWAGEFVTISMNESRWSANQCLWIGIQRPAALHIKWWHLVASVRIQGAVEALILGCWDALKLFSFLPANVCTCIYNMFISWNRGERLCVFVCVPARLQCWRTSNIYISWIAAGWLADSNEFWLRFFWLPCSLFFFSSPRAWHKHDQYLN